MTRFIEEGVNLRVEHTAKEFLAENGENILVAEHRGERVAIPFNRVLVAIGHTAAHQAWYAAVNALFGAFWKFRADYSRLSPGRRLSIRKWPASD